MRGMVSINSTRAVLSHGPVSYTHLGGILGLRGLKLRNAGGQAGITYTGLTPSIAELEATQTQDTATASTEAEAQTAEETAAPEATEAPAA